MFTINRSCCILGGVFAVVASTALAEPPTVITWIGGEGFWSVRSNWDPPMPSAAFRGFDVLIDGDNPAMSIVTLDEAVVVRSLVISAGDTLAIANSGALSVRRNAPGPGIQNNGAIVLAGSSAQPARIHLAAPSSVAFFGSGEIRLTHQSGSVIDGSSDVDSAFRNIGNIVRGTGRIGNGSLFIENHGRFIADVPFKSLFVDSGPFGTINLGVMESISGGWLKVSGLCANYGGVIQAGAGSFVELNNAFVEGGTLRTLGNGVLRSMEAPAGWANLRNEGRYMLGPTSLTLRGVIDNDGIIDVVSDLSMAGGSTGSEIVIDIHDGPVVLQGSGALAMLDCTIRAAKGAFGSHVVNGASHTIRGRGAIGNGSLSITNHGTILADDGTLVLYPGTGSTLLNTGTLRPEPGAVVLFIGGTFNNQGIVEVPSGAQFHVGAGSTIANMFGSMLMGGTWRVSSTDAPALLLLTGPNILTNFANVTLSGPGASFPRINYLSVNAGTFRITGGKTFTTFNSLANSGTVSIGAASTLHVSGGFTQSAAGITRLEVGSSTSDGGRIVITGTANLGGKLEIVLAEGADLSQGEVLEIMTFTGSTGGFTTVQLPPGASLHYLPQSVIVAASGSIPTNHAGSDSFGDSVGLPTLR
ncbi:MAG TPA: hypothetical protein PK400_06415 [Phycisphaerales bacterium]|nr:hypothetical protein [Phycisphaerales bacterium]HRQ75248.1 hypothetical protein [Phycisphaerales bacterium]